MFCKNNVSIAVGRQRNSFLCQSIALTVERLLEKETIPSKISVPEPVANMLMRRK
jgi:hypothetical protein